MLDCEAPPAIERRASSHAGGSRTYPAADAKETVKRQDLHGARQEHGTGDEELGPSSSYF